MIVKNDIEEFYGYLSDASNYKGYADSIHFPESETELIGLLKELSVKNIRATVTGNGTGLTGGRVPEGGTIISLEKLNRILEVNREERYIRVQPAVILKDLQDFVESKNLFYPPDPTENNCFIGATAATNASGARTFKYGATRNFVTGLRIVLSDGETISIERGKCLAKGLNASLRTGSGKEISFTLPSFKMPATKNAAGYYCEKNMDLIDLFIGSEGTLGIITELKLKLLPLPENVLSCIAFFPEEEDALNFIDSARSITRKDGKERVSARHILSSRALEFFDSNALDFLRPGYSNIPHSSKAAVWFEQDFSENEEPIISGWIELLKKNNCGEEEVWLALDKSEQEKFHLFRHSVSWKVNEFIVSRNLKKVGTDVAVPEDNFRSFYIWMKQLVIKAEIKFLIYGHFGNCHPHLNMLPENEKEYLKAREIYAEICREAVRLNGTISAEHGVGKLKRDYLLEMYGEAIIEEMAGLKLVFDPYRILNIGNIFDPKFLERS